MSKHFRHCGILLALCLSLIPGVAKAQWDFFVIPDELVLPAGSSYSTVWGYLGYGGLEPIDIRFVSFNDGLVAVGVTVDTTPFYDWVFNELTDLTLHLEPYVTYYFPLFNVEVAPDAPVTLYTPTAILEFDEIGGASGVALGASWQLEVVPEPASVVVLLSGVVVLLGRGVLRLRKG